MSGFVPLLSTVRTSSFLSKQPSQCFKCNGTPLRISTSKRIRNITRASIAVPESNEQVPASQQSLDASRTSIGEPVLDNDEVADEDIPLYAEVQDDDDEEDYELGDDDEDYEEDDDIVMEDDEDMEDDENWEDDDEAEITNVAPSVPDYTVISEQDYTSVRNTAIESPKYSEKAAEAFGSFTSVVDVNITVGGLLGIEDDDNNDLFSGIKFEALLDNEQVLANLESEMNITTMTHVQLAALPRIQDGDNVVIQGHTGTGKTLGFVLPILEIIDTELSAVQAVIIAPTRELAMQISREVSKLTGDTDITSMALIGGANPVRQTEKLRKKNPHIVIGTPGRLAELEASRALNLKHVEILVIDEVDQCLEAPFKESIEALYKYAPHHLQTVLVSATGDVDTVHDFVKQQFPQNKKNTTLLRVGDKRPLPKNIRNWYTVIPQRLRLETFRKLMFATNPKVTKGICFVDTPRRADIILEHLHKMKINAVGLRGTADKFERQEVLKMFRKGTVQLLVTTEIAARGLDVTDVSHVFNLDIPTDSDHYIHRAGRCGRVGRIGHVVTLVTPEKAFVIGKLQKELNVDITRMEARNGIYDKPIDRSNVPRRSASERKGYNGNNNNNNTAKAAVDGFVSSTISTLTSTAREERSAVVVPVTAPKRLGKTHQPAGTSNKNKDKKTKAPSTSSTNSEEEREKSKVNPKKKKGKIAPNSVPKRIRGNKSITAYAKKQGWVGNRSD